MADYLSTDLTFFNGIINETQVENSGKNARKSEKLNSRKSNSPRTGTGRKTQLSKSPKKENQANMNIPRRVSTKTERKPLAFLNEDPKAPDKENISTKKTGRRSTNSVSSGTEVKVTKKERHSVPKIIVYQDSPVKSKKEGKKKESKKCRASLSKSLDDSTATGRGKLLENRKSPKCKRNCHSFNDLTIVNVPSPRGKKVSTPGENTLAKTSPRQIKLKPGQPEFDEIFQKLESLFPNVDPDFLKSQLTKFKGSISQTIEFIIIKEKTNDLPTRDDYVRKLETERLQNKFLENFSVEDFLKMIPDPWEHFLKTEKNNSVKYIGHSLHYLKNKYKKHYTQAIRAALKKSGNSLYLANKDLQKKNRLMKMRVSNRSKSECDAGKPVTFDIQFLHEVAFIENESKIRSYIKKAETARYKKLKDAQKAGTLLKCQSCNDFSLLQDDTVNCPANHVFCKNCVVKYVEIEMEKNNFQFKCLFNCEKRFSMEALQAVFSPFVMTKIIRRNQLEEIKAAGIDDLVFCPFCFYVAIMPQEMTVFKCLNPACMMESCRLCKQFSHIPLKCHELEKFEKTVLEPEVDVKEAGEKEAKKEEENEEDEEDEEDEEEKEEEEEEEEEEEKAEESVPLLRIVQELFIMAWPGRPGIQNFGPCISLLVACTLKDLTAKRGQVWELDIGNTKCKHCNGEYVKKEDSNQMVCSCGATVCSICRQPFPECQHFKMDSSPSRLSSDGTEFADFITEVNPDSNLSKNLMAYLSSESDTF